MKILEIKINEFGCLSDRQFDLSEGFNLAMGDNESGKSTLLSFIKFIFYGLPKKNQDAHLDRDRGFGWRGNTADGSLTLIADDGKGYTVERRALRRGEKRETVTEECRIIDLQSGSPVFEGEDPCKIFLKVDAAVFESTCFIRQMGVTVLSGDDVGSALENILLSADEGIDLQSSLERLDEARKQLLHKKGSGGLIPRLEAEGEDLSHRLDKARIAYERILSATYTADKLKNVAMEKRNELNKLEDLFAAVSKAETVGRFDALHQKETELESSRRELTLLRENNKGQNGLFPSEALSQRLFSARTAYVSAKEEYSRASSAYKSALDEKEAEKNRSGSPSPLTAAEIRAQGGPDAICGELMEKLSLSRKKKNSARVFFVLFALILVAGGASLPFTITLGMPLVLISGALLLFSAVFAGMGASTLSAAKRTAAATAERLKALGFDIDL